MSTHSSFPIQVVKVLIKELVLRRVIVTIVFSMTLLAVVVGGLFYPLKFTTSTTIHADQQNIIAPLLRGQAEVTQVQDQSRVVRDTIYSPRILSEVIAQLDLAEPGTSAKDLELLQNVFRAKLQVSSAGSGFIKVSYSDQDPAIAFNVVSKATELFIKDASETKMSESREAFLFIDKQVKAYKQQLQEAEDRLKEFKSANIDGTEADVSTRITGLRAQIEEMELNLEEANTRVKSFEDQLSQESQYVARKFKADVYRQSLSEAQARLSTLRLSYKETYPDIVALKHQIADIQQSIADAENADFSEGSEGGEVGVNPLYEQLRLDLSNAKVNVETIKRRLRLTKGLLEDEYERLKRIAAQEAQLSELNRDYNVTRAIYEEMLDRKEKARLSMTLDIEGQGVTYKIQEPAVFPLNPSGLRFVHFVMLGPILGILFPVGIIVALIFVDPRIRFPGRLEEEFDVPILGVVPHVHTKLSRRVVRGDIVLLALFLFVVLSTYIGIVVLRVKGVL